MRIRHIWSACLWCCSRNAQHDRGQSLSWRNNKEIASYYFAYLQLYYKYITSTRFPIIEYCPYSPKLDKPSAILWFKLYCNHFSILVSPTNALFLKATSVRVPGCAQVLREAQMGEPTKSWFMLREPMSGFCREPIRRVLIHRIHDLRFCF